MTKRHEKQYELSNKDNCIVYLQSIISSSIICLDKLQLYNEQAKIIYLEYKEKSATLIPNNVYSDILDKSSSVISYLLNLFGDAQESSKSYYKYRNMVMRLCGKADGVSCIQHSRETQELLKLFNKARNWDSHIPESLLVAERKLIDEGTYKSPQVNPIVIHVYSSVSLQYFEHMYLGNCEFYENARKLLQAAKKDYSALIGDSVRIERQYVKIPRTMVNLESAKISAEVQGIGEPKNQGE